MFLWRKGLLYAHHACLLLVPLNPSFMCLRMKVILRHFFCEIAHCRVSCCFNWTWSFAALGNPEAKIHWRLVPFPPKCCFILCLQRWLQMSRGFLLSLSCYLPVFERRREVLFGKWSGSHNGAIGNIFHAGIQQPLQSMYFPINFSA